MKKPTPRYTVYYKRPSSDRILFKSISTNKSPGLVLDGFHKLMQVNEENDPESYTVVKMVKGGGNSGSVTYSEVATMKNPNESTATKMKFS